MSPIAFFCAEYAIEENLHLYAGGLGVLAGDLVLEAGKQGLPFHAFGLYYHEHDPDPKAAGYQILKDQNEEEILVDIDIADRPILARTWVKSFQSAKLYLLDTNVSANSDEDKEITKVLYGPTKEVKIKQQLVLAIGGTRVLERLEINPAIYHLNEGHTALVILTLAISFLADNPTSSLVSALNVVKSKIVSSKHTILPGAGIYLEKNDFDALLAPFLTRHKISPEEVFALGTGLAHPDKFSTTKFLLAFSSRANCVSKIHCSYELGVHPNSPLIPITNGVFAPRWQAKSWHDKDLATLPDDQLLKLHLHNKEEMFQTMGVDFNPKFLTIVWARRITAYKRPELLISNLSRLTSLLTNPERPVQIIISGQAGRTDEEGQKTVAAVKKICGSAPCKGKIVYVPNYSILVAKTLVKGADVWLNTPQVGKEACGTSGMKSGLNGALQFSSNDGWVAENSWDDVGWVLPEENIHEKIYSIIETEIVPTYYLHADEWAARMRKTMTLVQEKYTTTTMLKNYLTELYFPEFSSSQSISSSASRSYSATPQSIAAAI